MATTSYGTPYVQSSDLVSGWPNASLNVANRIDAVSYAGNGLNAQTGTSYTLVTGDAGKTVTLSNAAAVAVSLPQDSTANLPTGAVVNFYNLGAGTVTVSAGSGATLQGPSLSLPQYGYAAVIKLSANTYGPYVSAASGLVSMSPTSVTNGTASGGKISFTSQTTVTINGVFTSVYENYRLVVSTTEATRTSPIYARLCASGSAASGTDYCYYFVTANQSVGPSRSGANSATYMYLSETDAGASSANFMSFDIFGPQTTTRTRFTGSSMIGYANATTLFYATGGGNHILANSYDGISINCATAMTGTAYIYGYGK